MATFVAHVDAGAWTVRGTSFGGKELLNSLHVSLPHCKLKAQNGKEGNRFGVAGQGRLKVRRIISMEPLLFREVIAPVLEAGPWNIFDDYWEPSAIRDKRGFDIPPTLTCERFENLDIGEDVPEFMPQAQAAFDKKIRAHDGVSASRPGKPLERGT